MSQLSELDKCFRKGLIRKVLPSKDKSFKSMSKARRWLEEAGKNFDAGLFDSCLVSSDVIQEWIRTSPFKPLVQPY